MSYRLDVLAYSPVLVRRAHSFEEMGPLAAEIHVTFEGSQQRVQITYTLPPTHEEPAYVVRLSEALLQRAVHMRVVGRSSDKAPQAATTSSQGSDQEPDAERVYVAFDIDPSTQDVSAYARTIRPAPDERVEIIVQLAPQSSADDLREEDTTPAHIQTPNAQDRVLGLDASMWAEDSLTPQDRDALHTARADLKRAQRRIARAAQNAHRLTSRTEALQHTQDHLETRLNSAVQAFGGKSDEVRQLFEESLQAGHEQREIALWCDAAQHLVRLLGARVETRRRHMTRSLESDRHRAMLRLGNDALEAMRNVRHSLEIEVRDLEAHERTESHINRLLDDVRAQAQTSRNDLARLIAREKRLRQQLDRALEQARAWEDRIANSQDPELAEQRRAQALIEADDFRAMWSDHTLAVQHLQTHHRRVEALVTRIQQHKQTILFRRLIERARHLTHDLSKSTDSQHIHETLAYTRDPRASLRSLLRNIDEPYSALERLLRAAQQRRAAWREHAYTEGALAQEWDLRSHEALRMDRDELAHEAERTAREHEASAARSQASYDLSHDDVEELRDALRKADAVVEDLQSRKRDSY